MRYYSIFALVLLLLFCACNPKTAEKTETPFDPSALITQIDTIMKELLTDAENLKTGVLEKYLSNDPTDMYYLGAKVYTRKDLISALKQEYTSIANQKLEILQQKTYILGNEAAVWIANIRGIATNKDKKTIETIYTETWLWQKVNNEWKITHFNKSWQM
ncbi:MAG TPA: nuclear transport factor 2 family protein [Candidatus Cloacimonas acidaminovorans]|nr:nuclear transport factor 2 family protein [Candidatus Cloacimonas acidaminovorans]